MLNKFYQSYNNYKAVINTDSKKLSILLKSILVGLLVGTAVTLYRLALSGAEDLSFNAYAYLRDHMALLPLAIVLLAAAGAGVGFLVSKFKMIRGSGIPQVEGIIMGYFRDSWLGTLLCKFLGGAVSILAGLSLGREGPSIQLGACVAEGVGEKLASSRTEKKVLIASGASAGLAAAFNAPLAGTMFAMEEIFKYFSPVILMSTMVAAIVADFVAKLVFGIHPIFNIEMKDSVPLSGYWIFLVLGVTLGAAGAFYNYILLLTQKAYKKLKWLDARLRPVIPFLLACMLGLTFPIALGSGHRIIDELSIKTGIASLLLILAVKFVFSMISFGSGAPGGIFFPLLVMGGTIGAVFGNIAVNCLGFEAHFFYNFAIVAMAGYFTAIVRAPITGIVLLIEMTGSFTHLLALTFVSVIAYVVADLLKSAPIYESLLENMICEIKKEADESDEGKKITVELVVHHGSAAENKCLKEIDLPKSCLLIAVRRMGKDSIPRGDTRIQAGDYLVFLTNLKEEARIRKILTDCTTFRNKTYTVSESV